MARDYWLVPKTQTSTWRFLTGSSTQSAITAGDFKPYIPFTQRAGGAVEANDYGVTFGTAVYKSQPFTWLSEAPSGTVNFAYPAGTVIAVDAGVAAANALRASTPLGAITVMFFVDTTPLLVQSVGVNYTDGALGDFIDSSGTWTGDPLDNILVTALDSTGASIGTATPLSAMQYDDTSTYWADYDYSPGSTYNPGTRSADAYFLNTPCYGVRVQHANPGHDNPFALVLGALILRLASTGPTYLRQRQSPVRTPSRVRPPNLRQRQRPNVT